MIALIRILLIGIFAVVIFLRPYFPSTLLYWLMYVALFVLTAAFWYVSFWVSKKRAVKILGKEPESDFFCGMVPKVETADLIRGRLCSSEGKLVLVSKNQFGKYEMPLNIQISDIKSVGFGYVAGRRKGFTLHMGKEFVSFTSVKVFKDRSILYKLLGWPDPEVKK